MQGLGIRDQKYREVGSGLALLKVVSFGPSSALLIKVCGVQ